MTTATRRAGGAPPVPRPAPAAPATPGRGAARLPAEPPLASAGSPQSSAGRAATDRAGREELARFQDTRPAGTHPLAAAMTERQLEDGVRRILADLPGLAAYHPWVSVKSASGYPDWTVTGRWVMWRELKTEKGRLTKAQQAWLDALTDAGADAGIWRPSSLLSGQVARELAALAGLGDAHAA